MMVQCYPTRKSSRPDSARVVECTTGTAFAVGSSCLLTCAHVIEGIDDLPITSFDGRFKVEPVIVDLKNDIGAFT